MKKFLLTVMVVLAGFVTALAGDDIKLTEGSLATLKDGGLASVVLDLKDTQYDGKIPLRQDGRFALVDEQMENYTSEFVREFNDNSKKFKTTTDSGEGQYEINVTLTNIDTYVNVMSFKGGIGIKLWGSVTITNKATGEKVAVFTIDEENNSSVNYALALEEGYEGIAKFIAKRINKGK